MMRVGKKKLQWIGWLSGCYCVPRWPLGILQLFLCNSNNNSDTKRRRRVRKLVLWRRKKKSALPVCLGSGSLTQCFVFFGLLNRNSLLFWFWEVGLVSRLCLPPLYHLSPQVQPSLGLFTSCSLNVVSVFHVLFISIHSLTVLHTMCPDILPSDPAFKVISSQSTDFKGCECENWTTEQ